MNNQFIPNLIDIDSIKGFLAEDEGEALFNLAREASSLGPCLEVGSYCGKSTVYLGYACTLENNTLFAVDHHQGSEEHQPGEEYHDPDLFDGKSGEMNSFNQFRQTLKRAGLTKNVVPIVTDSVTASKHWATPLSLVFIDGGHSEQAAQNDYHGWAKHIVSGGFLAIHDIFPDPADGGQAPYHIYQQALASERFEAVTIINTLGILKRK